MFLLVGVKGQYHKTFDTSFVGLLSVLFAFFGLVRLTYAAMHDFRRVIARKGIAGLVRDVVKLFAGDQNLDVSAKRNAQRLRYSRNSK